MATYNATLQSVDVLTSNTTTPVFNFEILTALPYSVSVNTIENKKENPSYSGDVSICWTKVKGNSKQEIGTIIEGQDQKKTYVAAENPNNLYIAVAKNAFNKGQDDAVGMYPL